MRVSDLPEFSAVLDAHKDAIQADEGYLPEDWETGMTPVDQPLARDWINGLSTQWAGTLDDAPYVAPLAEIVRRVSLLSEVPCPELDLSEGERDRVRVVGGFDGEA